MSYQTKLPEFAVPGEDCRKVPNTSEHHDSITEY